MKTPPTKLGGGTLNIYVLSSSSRNPQERVTFSCIVARAVIDTFFRVDISEVNYTTCRYIIDNIQTQSFSIHHCLCLLWRKNGQKFLSYII